MNDSKLRFKQIIEENKLRIDGICRYYSSNSEDQKDLYQEILVNIWKRKPRQVSRRFGHQHMDLPYCGEYLLSFAGKAYRNMNLSIDQTPQSLNILLDNDELELKQKKNSNSKRLKLN